MIVDIQVNKIFYSRQPIKYYGSEYFRYIENLARSVKQVGLINPITVRRLNEEDNFEAISGNSRLRAMKLLGWDSIPCRILTMPEGKEDSTALAEVGEKSG